MTLIITAAALDELIAALEAEHAVISERLRLASSLRRTFDESPESAAKPARAADRATPITCPQCGKKVSTPRGLATHIGQLHKTKPIDLQAARDRAAEAAYRSA